MIRHAAISDSALRSWIRSGKISWGGHQQLKIYGVLNCTTGKKMKRTNRVFFASEQEALRNGYRPCGHCMRAAYKKWKYGSL
ncbi:Ada metal-binding domain-containing protein [Niabella yanshanensis]|uniref:Ada metal-binding domain-containing protein n=1 Tax=Niabella yanshanensis TaxID=577386 RepID=A0ABZ0W3L7_9BACT|nr:Ada metal-binding domain-containing protein [Niabella yanshanensis]WQD37863.1 Ada metal-binding domain-containing protein [Niabella yanshanensis]